MGQGRRKIIAGAITIPFEFEIAGYPSTVEIKLKTPQGVEVSIPMLLVKYEDATEYNEKFEKFMEATKELEKV